VRIRPIIKGLLTFVPGIPKILPRKRISGTYSASYCYDVWLKHLTLLWENGMRTIPNTLAELGPGDSLGTGLAAMLSGTNNYYALDVIKFSDIKFNLRIFDELVTLFKVRAKRPAKGWPDYDRYLDDNLFPSHILTNKVLEKSLNEKRISKIRNAIENQDLENKEVSIKYMVPWSKESIIQKETVDLILSHSVLEHVVDIENTYKAIHLWLKPGGVMSHQIDFRSHGLSKKWNGYRACPESLWKKIYGKRPFLINREPCSVHLKLMEKNNFKITCLLKTIRNDGIQKVQLSPRWNNISDDDLACSGAFIQAQKTY
jgi:SAM-dependent methyltransferase